MKLIIKETYDIDDFDFHIEAKREALKKFINKASQYFIDMGIVPTIEQVHDYVTSDRWAKVNIYDGANCKVQNPGWECLSLNKLCTNIRNMCSFNMNDIDESLVTENELYYTDTLDAIKDTLRRQFPELIVSIVNRPKRAVRVECEKELEDGNTLFNETFYIIEGSDGRIKALREYDKPVVFMDIDGVVNFFDEYLNS